MLDSDACHGDATVSGLGDYWHGYNWYFAVPEEDEPIVHTPLLEVLAVRFNILFFDHLYANAPECAPLFRTVAITTAFSMPRKSQRSSVMLLAFVHMRLTRQPGNVLAGMVA